MSPHTTLVVVPNTVMQNDQEDLMDFGTWMADPQSGYVII